MAESREEVKGNQRVAFKSVFKKQDARALHVKNEKLKDAKKIDDMIWQSGAMDTNDYDYIWLGESGQEKEIYLRNCPGEYFNPVNRYN